MYDARFKIPAQSNLGQLMVAKGKELTKKDKDKREKREYRDMVKKVEGYKRIVSALAKFFMGVSMICTMALYAFNIYELNKGRFFLARTRMNVTQTIDFEEITTNEVMYFLYRNTTKGATDVSSGNNWYIVPDVAETCEGKGFQLMKDLERITEIRDNIDSYFMIVSQSYVLVLMLIMAVLAVYVIPEMLKEHHVPMLFR